MGKCGKDQDGDSQTHGSSPASAALVSVGRSICSSRNYFSVGTLLGVVGRTTETIDSVPGELFDDVDLLTAKARLMGGRVRGRT